MNTQSLYSLLIDINCMISNIKMLEDRFKITGDEEAVKAVEYLVKLEKERTRKAYDNFLNTLSAQFYKEMNGGAPSAIIKTTQTS